MSGAGNPYAQYASAPIPPQAANPYAQYTPSAMVQLQPASGFDLSDIAKSALTGIAQGATSLAGLGTDALQFVEGNPRDIYNAIHGGTGKFPTNTQVLDSMVSAPTGGYHVPQTTAGQYAQTAGQFAPAAVGGEATIPLRLARVLIPATASEIAGQFTKGTAYEKPARLAAALLASVPTAGAEAFASASSDATPSIEGLRKAASDAYAKVDNSGMLIAQPAMKTLADATQQQLANLGIDKTLNPNAMAALDRLQSAADNHQTLQGMEVIRRVAQNAVTKSLKSPDGEQDAMMSGVVKRNIDNFVQGLGPQDVLGNVDSDAIDALSNARDLWRRASKSQDLEDLVDTANLRSAMSQATSSGQAIRGKFGQLAQNDSAMAGYSPEEQAAITKVAVGTPTERVARLVGKLSPDHALPLMMGLAEGGSALLEGDLPKAIGTAGVLGAGGAGKIISNAITARNARLAAELIRRGASGTTPQLSPTLASPLSPMARQLTLAAMLSQNSNAYGGSQ